MLQDINLEGGLFHKISLWSNLNKLANTPLTTLGLYGTAVVPILAVLKDFLGPLLEKIGMENVFSIPVLPLLIYCTSLLFSLASVITRVLSPYEIRKAPDFNSYIAHEYHRIFTLRQGDGLIFDVNSKIERFDSVDEVLSGRVKNAAKSVKGYEKQCGEISMYSFESIERDVEYAANLIQADRSWSTKNECKPNLRRFVALLYLISLTLTALIFFILMPFKILLNF